MPYLPGARAELWPDLLFTNSEQRSFCFVAGDWCVLRSIYSLYIIFFFCEPYFARFLNGWLLRNSNLLVNKPVELNSVLP